MSEWAWAEATWEGSRRAQQEAFARLSFRDEILQLEQMGEVVAALQGSRKDEPRRPAMEDFLPVSQTGGSGDAR